MTEHPSSRPVSPPAAPGRHPADPAASRRVRELMHLMAVKIRQIADATDDESVEKFTAELIAAKNVFVKGAGRSGLVARAFAMRLMHLGMQSHVLGETVTPAIQKGDVVVIFSGSGQTRTIADLAETARGIGARICLITAEAESRIGRIADCTVIIRLPRDQVKEDVEEFKLRQMLGDHKSFAPLGTLFETASFIFADAVISLLMEITGNDEDALRHRHANAE